jgi:ATP-dependent Clp protease ATP-binding subunit ClpB
VLQKYNIISARQGAGIQTMNLEKFTDRAKGFLQSAQTVAIRMNHQRIGPEHLLKALLEDEQGMAAGLIRAAGGGAGGRSGVGQDPRRVRRRRAAATGARQ